MAFNRGYPSGHNSYRRSGGQRYQEGRLGAHRNGPAAAAAGASADVARLVQQVKAVQKTGETSRTQWRDYCDVLGNGTRDPNKHSAAFLGRFFELKTLNELPVCEEPLHKKPIPGPDCAPVEAHTILVAKVKCGQQASAAFNAAWWDFSDDSAGTRDPSSHSVASLRSFLLNYTAKSGGLPDKNPYASPPRFQASPLSECVKSMQSARLVWKHQWDHFCDAFGNGVRDPSRHPPAFLQQFLDQVTPKHPQSRLLSRQSILCDDGLSATPPPVVKRRSRRTGFHPPSSLDAMEGASLDACLMNAPLRGNPALLLRNLLVDDDDSTSTRTGDDSSLSGCSTTGSKRRSSSEPPRLEDAECGIAKVPSLSGQFGVPLGSRVRNTFLEWDEHFLEQLCTPSTDST